MKRAMGIIKFTAAPCFTSIPTINPPLYSWHVSDLISLKQQENSNKRQVSRNKRKNKWK